VNNLNFKKLKDPMTGVIVNLAEGLKLQRVTISNPSPSFNTYLSVNTSLRASSFNE
jgi:hypothetical protein